MKEGVEMKRRTTWAFGLILICLFVAGIGARSAFRRITQHSRSGYTLTSEGKQYNQDGTSRRLFFETRYVSTNGNWHDVKEYDGGMVINTFGIVGQGVFARRNADNNLSFLSSYDQPSPVLTAEGFQQHGFLRTETLLGHQIFVTNPINTPQVELYNDPLLDGAVIKMVHKEDTNTVVIEPLAVVMGEPSASALLMPTGLQVSYDTFNNLHKTND